VPKAGRTAPAAVPSSTAKRSPGKDSRSLESGDLLRTETPGGGGWGR
jgi:N-methylhydantoinase B/oxoprolinase/acetone carboxylase alpha subunit